MAINTAVRAYPLDVRSALSSFLAGDLSFRGRPANTSTHYVHAFAAKFPAQLPNAAIANLTEVGALVCDPMVGSGTALVEAMLLGRRGIGFDIDPLAARISRVKTTRVHEERALLFAGAIVDWVHLQLPEARSRPIRGVLSDRYQESAVEFFEYWFGDETALELALLRQAVDCVAPEDLRELFEVILSSLIITKSGGVSLARDLAHSRPHRVNDKTIQSPLALFSSRAARTVSLVSKLPEHDDSEQIVISGDSRELPLSSNSVDLIVTSPPYANAIDYMRAHKFSLIWLGLEPSSLSRRRRSYIGAEVQLASAELSSQTINSLIRAVSKVDRARGNILLRYFADMRKSIAEMHRILKPGCAAVVVVGSSTIRGVDVRTPFGLAEEAEALGFRVAGVCPRPIDRNSRLLPISLNGNRAGIEARMHEEHVIGLLKPK